MKTRGNDAIGFEGQRRGQMINDKPWGTFAKPIVDDRAYG
jgi:hypothetical protein